MASWTDSPIGQAASRTGVGPGCRFDAGVSARLRRSRRRLPVPERVGASRLEVDPSPGDEIFHGAAHEQLAGSREGLHPRRDVYVRRVDSKVVEVVRATLERIG
jgi:hypothetical protein